MNICLNHRRMTFDFCRHCRGYDIDCPEYLSDIEHTRQTKPKAEQLDEHECRILGLNSETKNSITDSFMLKDKTAESYSRPVVLLQNVRSKVEPMLPRPDFLERFRRYQR